MRNKRLLPMLILFLLLSIVWLEGESLVLADEMVDECFENENCNDSNITPIDEETSSDTVTWVSYIKLIAALAFVLILLYALLKFVNSRTRNFQQSKLIQNMGGTTLGGNRSVQIVKVAGTYYVLGVGEDVHLIKEIIDVKEQEKLEQYYQDKDEQQTEPSPLSNLLKKMTKQGNKQSILEKQSFQSLLSKQLNQHKEDRKKLFNRTEGKEQDKDG